MYRRRTEQVPRVDAVASTKHDDTGNSVARSSMILRLSSVSPLHVADINCDRTAQEFLFALELACRRRVGCLTLIYCAAESF